MNSELSGGVLGSTDAPVCIHPGSKIAVRGKKGLQVFLLHPVLQPASWRGASSEGITGAEAFSLVRAVDHTRASQPADLFLFLIWEQLMVSSEMLDNFQKHLSEVQIHFNLECY